MGNQRAKFWKRWETMRREQSGGISHSDKKDTIRYNRRKEDGAERGGLVHLMVER